MSETTKRPYDDVFPVAQHIVKKLAPHCERIEIAGSLRRGREMIGDIEIVALPQPIRDLFENKARDVTYLDAFLAEKGVQFAKNGRKYKQFAYGAHTVDLFLPAGPEQWGSIFTIRTGSHDFNMWVMQKRAPAVGVKFRGGLIYGRGGTLLSTPEETDVFDALQLPWIPPQHRDDGRWMEYARLVVGSSENST